MNTMITGASSGIGRALAIECARRGDNLFICGRDRTRLEAVAEECRKCVSASVHAAVVDITDRAAVDRWVDECDDVAPLERVFANAGVSTGKEIDENVRAVFAINIAGTLNTVQAVLGKMRPRGRGQILLTSSIAGYGPLSSCPAYSATKACLRVWALSLRGMLAREGIKVSAICPGFVRSRITDRNTCPMPFFMEADRAARIILDRVDRNVGLIAFPAPMRLASWFLSVCPWRLAEWISGILPEKNSDAQPNCPF